MDNKKPPESGENEMRNDEWEEFEKVCRPVVEFLQKRYCTPHHRVIIDWDSAVIVQDIRGIPFKCPD